MSKNVKLLLLVVAVLVVALIIVYLAIPKDKAPSDDYSDYTETSSETEVVSSEGSSVSSDSSSEGIDIDPNKYMLTDLYDETYDRRLTMEELERLGGTTDPKYGTKYIIIQDKSAEEKEAESGETADKSKRDQMKVMCEALVDSLSRHKEINENLKLLLEIHTFDVGTVDYHVRGVLREDAKSLRSDRILFKAGVLDTRGKGNDISVLVTFEVESTGDANAMTAWVNEVMQEILPADTYKLFVETKERGDKRDIYPDEGLQAAIRKSKIEETVGTTKVKRVTKVQMVVSLEELKETEGTE